MLYTLYTDFVNKKRIKNIIYVVFSCHKAMRRCEISMNISNRNHQNNMKLQLAVYVQSGGGFNTSQKF